MSPSLSADPAHYATRRLERRLYRLRLWQRDKLCRYCRRPISRKRLTLDHVIAKSAGGTERTTNLRLACKTCNEFKSDKRPVDLALWLVRVLVATARARMAKGGAR